jgi:hypothetical protein
MDNFKKLIQEKNNAIKEYGDFIKTLKNKECDKDVLGLIGLLKDRLAKFENLSCDNYSQTAADIDELNDRIYRQVNLLANLDKLSRDSDVYKKYNEVYNLKRIKLFVSEQICRVKKYYQVLIALLGLIPFIIYFIFWQNVGFFSIAGSDSIFSLLSALAISGFGLFVILYIFPALHLVLIVSYDGGEKRNAFLRDLSDSHACWHSIYRRRIFFPERGRFKLLFRGVYSANSHILPTLQL